MSVKSLSFPALGVREWRLLREHIPSRRGIGVGPHAILALHALWPATAVTRGNGCDARGRRDSENIGRTPPGLVCEFGPIYRN